MGLKELMDKFGVRPPCVLELKSDQNGIERNDVVNISVFTSSKLKSDQNGIESLLYSPEQLA